MMVVVTLLLVGICSILYTLQRIRTINHKTSRLAPTIFKEYDIRGVIDSELVLSEIYPLTRAMLYYFAQRNPEVTQIVIGRDARVHSPAIEAEVVRAVIDSGLSALLIGECPTPVMYYAMYTAQADAGIMITASHNPPEYNGFKLMLGTYTLSGYDIQEIRRAYEHHQTYHRAGSMGSSMHTTILQKYIDWLCTQFADLQKKEIPIIIDCGNGMASVVLQPLIERMEWPAVQLLYAEVDGTCPNHPADPTVARYMHELQKRVQTTDVRCGIGLDGDCDRMTVMTKAGVILPGDKTLVLFGSAIPENSYAVVLDIKGSDAVAEWFEQRDITVVFSPSGHSIIKKAMVQHNALLAGELSGHFFFADRGFGFDDGIYACLRYMELLANPNYDEEAILGEIEHRVSSPEFRIACTPDNQKQIITVLRQYYQKQQHVRITTIDGIRVQTQESWGLARGSNTQPVICFRFEGINVTALQKIMEQFSALVERYVSTQQLSEFMEDLI